MWCMRYQSLFFKSQVVSHKAHETSSAAQPLMYTRTKQPPESLRVSVSNYSLITRHVATLPASPASMHTPASNSSFANSMQWAALTVSLAARCGVSRLTVAGWIACSTTAWPSVSDQGEPLVAHKACQVCQYCNEREAARRKTSLGGRSNSGAGE
jgi:hypothetical protein